MGIHGKFVVCEPKDIQDAEKFRNHGEAVCDRDIKIFVAPLHKLVLNLMENLFGWMNKNKEIIKETELPDSTVRRTLKNLLKKEKIVSESESINSPNRRYKMTE